MRPMATALAWKSKLMAGPYRPLFVVAILAYMLGVLTSPAIPLVRTVKPVGTPEQQITSTPAVVEQSVRLQSNDACKKEEQQPVRGHMMLSKDLITFHDYCQKQAMAPDAIRAFITREIFDGVSPYEDFPSPCVADLIQPERISGWGSEKTVFRRLMEEVRPRVVIELGSFLGASATHMGGIAKELGLKTEIFCFDDWRGWPGFRSGPFADLKQQNGNNMLLNQFLQNVIARNMSDRILPMPFGTVSSLTTFCKWGMYADLIEVDASHDFHSAWADINIAYRLLRPGGVIFGHDYFTGADKKGVRRAVDLFAKLNGLRVEPDGQHWIYRSQKA